EIARRHDLFVVEDAAQALGSKYKGRRAGCLGHLATFSFHETKNIISGEGGALAINDPALIERAEVIREKGTDRKKFHRGQVEKYSWVDIGSSFLPGELVAAFLFAQLEHVEAVQKERMESWQVYDVALKLYHNRGIRTPIVPEECEANAHMYFVLMPTFALRQ